MLVLTYPSTIQFPSYRRRNGTWSFHMNMDPNMDLGRKNREQIEDL